MKHIVIIGSRRSGTKNNPAVLASSLKASVNTTVMYWEDILISIKPGAVSFMVNGQELFAMKPDLVIAVGWYKSGKQSVYRDLAYSTALYLQHHTIPFWNSEMLLQRSTTKLSCMVQLALHDLPVPSTLFSLSTQLVREHATLPCIVKAVAASRGKSNHLVSSWDEFDQVQTAEETYIVQPYLENTHDLRVICFNAKPQAILKRERSPEARTHLNNVSQGATAEWLNLTDVAPELLTISEKICKVMGREMAGIDFIPDTDASAGYSCLEVNAVPQLTSGYDTEKKMEVFRKAVIDTIGE